MPSEPLPAGELTSPESVVTPPESPAPVSEAFVAEILADGAPAESEPVLAAEAPAAPAPEGLPSGQAESRASAFVEDEALESGLETLPTPVADLPVTECVSPEPEFTPVETQPPPLEPAEAPTEPESLVPPAPEPPAAPLRSPPVSHPSPVPSPPQPKPVPAPAPRRDKSGARRSGSTAPPKRAPRQPPGAWNPQRVDPVVVAFHDRYSAVCEQYRSVRARLLTINTSRAAQVIGITSAIPEEGKSVTALNLSLVMAEGGEHRILLADADFRRASIARMLGIPEQPGLAEVLRGEIGLAQALQPTPFPNLKVLTAGRTGENGYAELLGGNAVAAALEEFRNGFDYTFLDTPPITTVSDVCLLAPQSDGVIVVIQMRRTPEPTVQQAVRTLQANNIKILGSILSRYRERGAGYYEHYYSSYYYH